MSLIAAPLRRLKVFGTTTDALLGLNTPATSVGAAFLAGMTLEPLEVPTDFDRTRDAFLTTWLFRPAGPLIAGANVVVQVATTITPPNSTPTEAQWEITVAIPTNLPNQTLIAVPLLNGSAAAFPRHSIPAGSMLGVRVGRDGPDANDTYPVAVAFPDVVTLGYNQLCQWPGCI